MFEHDTFRFIYDFGPPGDYNMRCLCTRKMQAGQSLSNTIGLRRMQLLSNLRSEQYEIQVFETRGLWKKYHLHR